MLQLNKPKKFNPSEGMDEGRFIIEQSNDGFIKKYVLIFQSLGNDHLPKLFGDNAKPYIDPIKRDYETIYPKVEATMGGALQKQFGKMEMNESNDRVKELMHHKDLAVSECLGIQQNCSGEPSYFTFINIAICVFCILLASCGEIIFQSIAMQGIPGITPIFGLILGVGLFVVTTVISILSRNWINTFKSERIKKMAHIFVAIILLLLFYAMAELRDSYQQTMNNGGVSNFWGFIVINFCLSFAIYLMIVFWFLPLKEKVTELINYIQKVRKINKLQKEIKACDEEIKNIKVNLPKQLRKRMETMHLSEQYKELINNYYYQCVHNAIQANTERQKAMPDCFNISIPPLEFRIFNTDLKNSDHEN